MKPAALPLVAAPGAAIRAALMMALCCACVAGSTFFAKMLGSGAAGEPMHPFMVVFGRYLFALVAILPFALHARERMGGSPWRLYIGRSIFGTAGVAGLFTAVAMIPLADATAISFLNPVFAMILAVLFLGERVGRWRWGAAAVSLAGGVLVIRPGAGTMEPGALIALAAAIFIAAEIIFTKVIARTESVLRGLIGVNLVSTIITFVAAMFVWRAPTAEEWMLMAAVGWAMVAAQTLFMSTLRIVDSSFATPFFYGTLLFAALYDALWFGVIPAPLSFLGAALIVIGAVVLAVREARAQRARAAPPIEPPGA